MTSVDLKRSHFSEKQVAFPGLIAWHKRHVLTECLAFERALFPSGDTKKYQADPLARLDLSANTHQVVSVRRLTTV